MSYEVNSDYSVSSVQDEIAYSFPLNVEPEPAAASSPEPHQSQPDPTPAPARDDNYRGLLLKQKLLAAYDSSRSEDGKAPLARLRDTEASAVDALDPGATDESELTPVDPGDSLPAEDDFSQIGAAFAGRPAPQTFWNEEAVNVVSTEGLKQGSLSTEQKEQNAQLASEALKTETASGVGPPLQISAGDLALIVRESGISFARQDPNQLKAAASYLNDANDAAVQQDRLRKTLDVFHILDRQGLPQLSREQMIGELWVAARVPTHAIEKMNNAELARTFQSVASAINGPAGQQKLKVGDHDLTLTINDANKVVDSKTTKPSIWGKIGKIALTVASFVPGPVGIAARIASSVISAAEGIKNKNWVQAVVGGASGVAAGAGAIAGRAISGAAATTARVADSVAKGARALQTGLAAVQAKDGAGVFKSLAGMGSAVAGAFGDSAETVAGWARNVEKWAGRAYVAAEVRNISQMGLKDQLLAVGGHGANLILDSGDLRAATSSFEVKWKLGVDVGQTIRAGIGLQRAIKSGDVLLMSEAAAGLSAITHNSYRNAASASELIKDFDARERARQLNAPPQGSQPDSQYDGVWINNNGPLAQSGQFTLPMDPVLPGGDLDTTVPTVYVNGVSNNVEVQTNFMRRFADASGSGVFGVHNATQGVIKDIWQSLKDKLDIGRNPPVDTLAKYIYGELTTGDGEPVNLAGHSQGALIISRALTDVRNRLRLERGLSEKEVESLLGNVTVTTFGGASGHYPDGPQYFHYINRGDYVAMPGGLGGDLLPFLPLLHAGRDATIIRFSDFSLPNPHDSGIYLNMYRRPETFANGKNPYTPEEMKKYKIGR